MIISDEIQKQVNAGFSAVEIKNNLKSMGFADAEIQQNMKAVAATATARSADKPKPWAIILAILAIIRGMVYMGKGFTVLGLIMIGAGIVGFIAYAARQ